MLADELPMPLVLGALERPELQAASVMTLLSMGFLDRSAKPNLLDTSEGNIAAVVRELTDLEESIGLVELNDENCKKQVRALIDRIRSIYSALPIDEQQRFIVSRVRQLPTEQQDQKHALAGECRLVLFRGGDWESWLGCIKNLPSSGVGILTPIDQNVDTRSFIPVGDLHPPIDAVGSDHAWLSNNNGIANLDTPIWERWKILTPSPIAFQIAGFSRKRFF